MTLAHIHAEETCLKNQQYRFSRPDPQPSPLAPEGSSADLEKQDVVHEEQLSDSDNNDYGAAVGKFYSCDGPGQGLSRQPSTVSTLTFPEGGIQAWLVVFGSFCAMLSVFGVINSSAVFESYFSTHQLSEYSPSQIGWIFSLYLFFVFFVGIQVGPLFDRHGPRLLVAIGSCLMASSLLLLGFCTGAHMQQEYYQILLTYSVLGGLGGAFLNSPAYGAIAHFFNTRRGFATGIATTAGGIGGILFPLLLQRLLPQLGFAWSTRILGFIQLALAIPANLWIRARLPRRRDHVGSIWPVITVLKDKSYALSALGTFFLECGLFVPLTFIVSFAAAHGQDPTASYTLLALLNAGSVLGRFLPGLLADMFGRFNVIIITITLCCATVFGLWLPAGTSQAMIISFALLFGFASGSNLGLVPVCVGQLCDPRDYARYISTANFVASFGTLSSVPLGGALLGLGGGQETGWMSLILFSGTAYALALLCYMSARILAVGWSPKIIF